MTVERTVTVSHEVGLHARPAREVVDTASGFDATVTVGRVADEDHAEHDESASAASLLELTALGVETGEAVRVRAEGPDERDAVDAVADAVAGTGGEA